MDPDTDVSSHHTTTSPVDTATSITTPNYSRQSETGSGRKRKAPRWSLDDSPNMPAASSLPAAKEAKLETTDTVNFAKPSETYSIDHILSSNCPGMDAELPRYARDMFAGKISCPIVYAVHSMHCLDLWVYVMQFIC